MLWNGEVANCRLSKAEHGVRAGTRRPSQASARGDAPRGRTRLAGGRYLRGRDWLDSGGVCAVRLCLHFFSHFFLGGATYLQWGCWYMLGLRVYWCLLIMGGDTCHGEPFLPGPSVHVERNGRLLLGVFVCL